MGGGAGITRGGGGGTLIPTLILTSAKPLFERAISVRSIVPINNIMNIFLFIKQPPLEQDYFLTKITSLFLNIITEQI
jgi:hypothetical protein